MEQHRINLLVDTEFLGMAKCRKDKLPTKELGSREAESCSLGILLGLSLPTETSSNYQFRSANNILQMKKKRIVKLCLHFY